MFIESVGKDANSRTAGQATSSFVNDFDVIGFPEAELLSENVSRPIPSSRFTSIRQSLAHSYLYWKLLAILNDVDIGRRNAYAVRLG